MKSLNLEKSQINVTYWEPPSEYGHLSFSKKKHEMHLNYIIFDLELFICTWSSCSCHAVYLMSLFSSQLTGRDRTAWVLVLRGIFTRSLTSSNVSNNTKWHEHGNELLDCVKQDWFPELDITQLQNQSRASKLFRGRVDLATPAVPVGGLHQHFLSWP